MVFQVSERDGVPLYDVCEEAHPKAQKMTFHDIKGINLAPMKITRETVFEITRKLKSSVTQESIDDITYFKSNIK